MTVLNNIVDMAQWPICVMNAFPSNMEETKAWVEEMDLILERKNAFCLVYPPITTKSEDMEAMKFVRRWLKTSKTLMELYCKGIIITVNQQTDDESHLQHMAPILAAVYGTQTFVEQDIDASLEKAKNLL